MAWLLLEDRKLPSHQDKISEFEVLCLLRRFLFSDDYEKLAAMEAYDASRAPEPQEQSANTELC